MFDDEMTKDPVDVDDVDEFSGSDIKDSESAKTVDIKSTDDLDPTEENTEELSDDVYHAVRMSEEEVERIENMWKEPDIKVEPYRASKALDSSCNADYEDSSSSDDIYHYHATKMSDEEVKRIDDMWRDELKDTETKDIEENCGEGNDACDAPPSSIEEQFAADVKTKDFDAAEEEQKLNALNEMSDEDILNQSVSDSRKSSDMFAGLSIDELRDLKEGLENKDPDTYRLFGLDDDDDGEMRLVKKMRMNRGQ